MTVDKLLDKIIELEHELSKTKVQLAIESNSLLVYLTLFRPIPFINIKKKNNK